MKKQLNLDRLEAALAEHAAKSVPQAERARTAHDSDDRAPFALDEWPYIQVADRIERRIGRGEFGKDGKLPGEPELAEWYGVGIKAVRHARQELKRRGLVVVVQGRGTVARTRRKAAGVTGSRRGCSRRTAPALPQIMPRSLR
jgi:DNA-binding transcriptional regulator YhcF (GntR family)